MATKKTTAKKSTAKKAPAKKRSAAKSTKMPEYKSFKVTNPDVPFFTIRVTKQTIYWSILCILALSVGLWTIMLAVGAATF